MSESKLVSYMLVKIVFLVNWFLLKVSECKIIYIYISLNKNEFNDKFKSKNYIWIKKLQTLPSSNN